MPPGDRFESDSEDEDESLTIPKPSGDDPVRKNKNNTVYNNHFRRMTQW